MAFGICFIQNVVFYNFRVLIQKYLKMILVQKTDTFSFKDGGIASVASIIF